MKKHIFITFVLLAFLNVSCSSDSDNESIMEPPAGGDDVTYTGNVKAIIDSNCISCHGDPLRNDAPMPLLSSANVQQAIQNRNLIGRIENGSMPPNGSLTAAQIQAVKDWQTQGFN